MKNERLFKCKICGCDPNSHSANLDMNGCSLSAWVVECEKLDEEKQATSEFPFMEHSTYIYGQDKEEAEQRWNKVMGSSLKFDEDRVKDLLSDIKDTKYITICYPSDLIKDRLEFKNTFRKIGFSKDWTYQESKEHQEESEALLLKYPEIKSIEITMKDDCFHLFFKDKEFVVKCLKESFLARGLVGYRLNEYELVF